MVTLITYTENRVTNPIDDAGNHRTPLPCATRTYELTGFTPSGPADRYQPEDFVEPDPENPGRLNHRYADEVAYEANATSNPCRRPIEQIRSLYRPDDCGEGQNDPLALLPLGELESLALPGESYQLSFTPGLITQVFQRDGQPLISDPLAVLGGNDGDRGGYVDLDDNGNWWIPSGRVFFSNCGDSPSEELVYGRAHLFLPHCYVDPFGQATSVAYDAHDLLIRETRDALGNTVTVGERQQTLPDGTVLPAKTGNDYRVLQPWCVMDPNGNRTALAFDALGMVVGTAVMGKQNESLGDSLDGFQADLPPETIEQIFNDPKSPISNEILNGATTRIVYDFDCYRDMGSDNPGFSATIAREHHLNSPPQPGIDHTRLQISFSYSDGFGREVQRKIQAEAGAVPRRDGNGRIVVDAEGQPEMTVGASWPRWVGSGWTVFNNKGKPVRQFEPFFSHTHRFDDDPRIGVSPYLVYDPVERVVATLHPNQTYEKVIFSPWRQETWDVNDTVLQRNPEEDPHVGGFFTRLADDLFLPTWHTRRIDGQMGQVEQDAAAKAAAHADTPELAYFDTLGRPFLTIADNGIAENGAEQKYETRVELDIEGNQRDIEDARGNPVMTYDYDMLGNPIRQHSMDGGRRWILKDAAGQEIRRWDDLNRVMRTTYDALRRPTELRVSENGAAETLAEQTHYGELQASPEANNLRGQVYEQRDGAGIVTLSYDFKGNVLETTRQLLANYRNPVDWSQSPSRENETFRSRTNYDALNRPIQIFAPHSGQVMDLIQYTYNAAGLLESVDVWLKQQLDPQALRWLDAATANYRPVSNIDYNARGQRTLIRYGSGSQEQDRQVFTDYDYDAQTFRLTRLHTVRPASGAQLQDLNYTYDPVGNITHIRDDAQQTIFFSNRRVEPSAAYTYDAVYQLIEATGREHLGQIPGNGMRPPRPLDPENTLRTDLPHPNDRNTMGRYVQQYQYDRVGNFVSMRHRGTDPFHRGWRRCYQYAEDSNRLLSTGGPRDAENLMDLPDMPCPENPYASEPVYPARYDYDAHGNMTRMPHLPSMRWDFKDQLHATTRQVVNNGATPETTCYVYDANGERVRKVTLQSSGRLKNERIYLGGFEIYREYDGNGSLVLERETLHVMDNQQRVALIETRTQGDDGSVRELMRYQLGNHLGSSSLELGEAAEIISYEEYYPYGSTSYQAVRGDTDTPKRYRYTGKERDEESGLNYYGARYYAAWLGRWCSSDPSGIADGPNEYKYAQNNPATMMDSDGNTAEKGFWQKAKTFLFDPKAFNEMRREAGFVGGVEKRVEKIRSEEIELTDYSASTVDASAVYGGVAESAKPVVPVAKGIAMLTTIAMGGGAAYGMIRGASLAYSAGNSGAAIYYGLSGGMALASTPVAAASTLMGEFDAANIVMDISSPGGVIFSSTYGLLGMDPIEGAKAGSLLQSVGEIFYAGAKGIKNIFDNHRAVVKGSGVTNAEVAKSSSVNSNGVEPDIYMWELFSEEITAGRGTYRGFSSKLRKKIVDRARRYGATGELDVGHDTAHAHLRPGEKVKVRAQDRAENRAEGWDISRAKKARQEWNRQNPNLQLSVR